MTEELFDESLNEEEEEEGLGFSSFLFAKFTYPFMRSSPTVGNEFNSSGRFDPYAVSFHLYQYAGDNLK